MSTSSEITNRISSADIFTTIEAFAKRIIDDKNAAAKLPAIMLRGAPGVGKSTIVKSVAEKLGIGFIDVRLAQMERVDFSGLPSINNGITQWNNPSFWPSDPTSKGIILLDEITSAPNDVQVAAYSIVLDRRIPNSNYVLPDGWLIVAAGNRAVDKAVVKSMSSALANRFVHYEVEANAEEWGAWAITHNINPAICGFINYRPALLFSMDNQNLEQGWPSPRSWERVSNVIDLFGSVDKSEELLRKSIYGLVGKGTGVEFFEFFKMNKNFQNVAEVMRNEKMEIQIPEKADEKFALTSAIIYNLWKGKSSEETQLLVDGFYRYLLKMPNDFAKLMIQGAMVGNGELSKIDILKLFFANPHYKECSKKFDISYSEENGL